MPEQSEKASPTMTKELHNSVVKMINERVNNTLGYYKPKNKSWRTQQRELYVGAVIGIDLFNQSKDSCLHPAAYVSIIRDEEIKVIE